MLSFTTCQRTRAVFSLTMWVLSIGRASSENPQNLNKTIARNEKFNVTDLSLLREVWGNNDAHWIMTAEADGLTTDAKQVL